MQNDSSLDALLAESLPSLQIQNEREIIVKSSQSYPIAFTLKKSIPADFNNQIWLTTPNAELCEDIANDLKGLGLNAICYGLNENDNFKALQELKNGEAIIFTLPKSAENELTIDISQNHFTGLALKKGCKINTEELLDFLQDNGYFSVPVVQNESEFSLRGEVLDIFTTGSTQPHRVYLDFDTIESIKPFDVSTQLSGEYSQIDTLLIQSKQQNDTQLTTPVLSYKNPKAISIRILDDYEDTTSISNITTINTRPSEKTKCLLNISIERFKILLETGTKIFICCENESEKTDITTLIKAECEELVKNKNFNIIKKQISSGFYLADKLAVFTFAEIFSKKKVRNYQAHARLETASIDSFLTLKEGELVVHINYGVGKFLGIVRMENNGCERDYVKLEYANEEYYYIPLEKANCIQKYIGQGKISLDNPHTSSWKRKKEKALENATQFAKELLELYAKRSQEVAFSHHADTPWALKFKSGFEWQETGDQLKAIEDVTHDMESPTPMDRIICGDVGFGKTEIAFRAAFKAIMSARQVCMLAPTTILTDQHYRNFLKRIQDFPIKACQLSRIISSAECKKTIQGIEDGSVDIVFATHKILHSNVRFKNLGLLIIDEEQRFGVKDKEKIKSIKHNIDTLTLTATPIPRTLYLSMINLRSMSLLKTPPVMRKSVKVYTGIFDWQKVIEAIDSELKRKGQVYYLHNKTADLESVASFIRAAFPNANVDCVSGKSSPVKTEDSIHNFVIGKTDILVCTTIIENGIDVPNANTLIVDNATIYGTSQLYQIKGRVGRSSSQGYAYLFLPKTGNITKEAKERIKIIGANSTLGSGFNIALGDLMLRGSGNILGKEQAGHVDVIGLELYLQLLDKCIKSLKQKQENPEYISEKLQSIDEDEISIMLPYTAYIPDNYIKEAELKFEIYKKISNSTDLTELQNEVDKTQNRFGPLPEPAKSLVDLARLKIACKKAGIATLSEKNNLVSAKIRYVKNIKIDKVLSLISSSKGKIYLDASHPEVIFIKASQNKDDRINEICNYITQLA